MAKISLASAIVLSGALLLGSAQAATLDVSVDGQAGPWNFGATLNSGYAYGDGTNAPPTVVSAGFNFAAGGVFTITYLDGLTSPYGGTPYADGIGDTAYTADNNPGNSGQPFPSAYIDTGQYPAYLAAPSEHSPTLPAGIAVGTPSE